MEIKGVKPRLLFNETYEFLIFANSLFKTDELVENWMNEYIGFKKSIKRSVSNFLKSKNCGLQSCRYNN